MQLSTEEKTLIDQALEALAYSLMSTRTLEQGAEIVRQIRELQERLVKSA